MPRLLLTSCEAFAHAALEAGVGVVAGCPATPASGVVETVARLRAKERAKGVWVEWSADEAVAIEICAAASISGTRSLFVSKQSGLNVAADALVALGQLGTHGGIVLLVVDDPELSASQALQDTRTFAQFAHIPIFDIATPQQGLRMIAQAFELSEAQATPVVVRATTRICCQSSFFDVRDQTQALSRKSYDAAAKDAPIHSASNAIGNEFDSSFGSEHRWVLMYNGEGAPRIDIARRQRQISHSFSYDHLYACFNPVWLNNERIGSGATNNLDDESADAIDSDFDEPTSLGIVAGGESLAFVQEALELLKRLTKRSGLSLPNYKLMQVGTPWPFPRRAIIRFFKGLSDVLVLEGLDPFIEGELLKVSGTSFLGPTIHGQLTNEAPPNSAATTEEYALRIARFFDEYSKDSANETTLASDVTGADSARYAVDAASTKHMAANSHQGYEPNAYDFDTDDFYNFDDEFAESELNMDFDMQSSHESKVARRLAALHKETTFSELAERAVGADALYDFIGALPDRSPEMCAGCPHRASFIAINNALSRLGIGRNEVITCGDVGCHELGVRKPFDMIDACLCLGSGVSLAQGFSTTLTEKRSIAFIGDGSLFSSGLPSISNMAYNAHNVTFVVMNNRTTALTGLEPNPGTGATMMGTRSNPLAIEPILRALGIEAVHRADPLNCKEAEEACVRALDFPGASAVILTSPCIFLKSNDRFASVDFVRCAGCKKCISETGCPALGFDVTARGPKSGKRGQTVIDEEACTGCGLCAQVCPFNAINLTGRDVAALAAAANSKRMRTNKTSANAASTAATSTNSSSSILASKSANKASNKLVAKAANESTSKLANISADKPANRASSATKDLRDTASAENSTPTRTPDDTQTSSESSMAKEVDSNAEASAKRPEKEPEKKPEGPSDSINKANAEVSLESLFGGQVRIDLNEGDL